MRFRVVHEPVVDSTNERAFAALADGSASDGWVVVAERQTAGRGRRGARWESPAKEGLYASVVLAPERPFAHPACPTLAGALAALDAVRDLGADAARLKWPNDLVAGEAKLAGVLVETRGFDPERPEYVLGLGLNVRQTSFPPALLAERPVTSLARLGVHATVAAVLDAWLVRLDERLDETARDPEATARAALDALHLAGRVVRVRAGDREPVEGRLTALTLADGVVLDVPAGGRVAIALGHVRAVEPTGAT